MWGRDPEVRLMAAHRRRPRFKAPPHNFPSPGGPSTRTEGSQPRAALFQTCPQSWLLRAPTHRHVGREGELPCATQDQWYQASQ